MPVNDSWSPLGVVAAVAAYTNGDEWLEALRERLDELRTCSAGCSPSTCPWPGCGRLEATYLAWVDLRAYGHDDPAAVALERAGSWRPGATTSPVCPVTSASTSPPARRDSPRSFNAWPRPWHRPASDS